MKKFPEHDEAYTDEEINELADWFSSLTIRQIFFLKETYESFLKHQAVEVGQEHVH